MFISDLFRMALKARIEGKVEYTDERVIVWLVINFNVNFSDAVIIKWDLLSKRYDR